MSYIQPPATGGQAVSEFLDNYKLLTIENWSLANGLPSSNIYGWNNDGISDFDGSGYIGGIDLTEVGAVSSAENHLGNDVFCDFDGVNDLLYANNAAFDSVESFTCFGVFKFGEKGSPETLMSKWGDSSANNSFFLDHDSSTKKFTLNFYFSTSSINFEIDSRMCLDSKFHLIALTYDFVKQTYKLTIDGRVYAIYKEALATRNNDSASNLTFCGKRSSGNVNSNFFKGQACEFGYYAGALTFQQLRKLYLYVTKNFGYEDEKGIIRISGETGPQVDFKAYSVLGNNANINLFTTPIVSTLLPENMRYEVFTDWQINLTDGSVIYEYISNLNGVNASDFRTQAVTPITIAVIDASFYAKEADVMTIVGQKFSGTGDVLFLKLANSPGAVSSIRGYL